MSTNVTFIKGACKMPILDAYKIYHSLTGFNNLDVSGLSIILDMYEIVQISVSDNKQTLFFML